MGTWRGKNQCFGYAVFNCFVARSDAVAELGSKPHGCGECQKCMDAISDQAQRRGDRHGEYDASHKAMNESHGRQTSSYIWIYFGGSVDIEGAFIDRHRE